jgi:hypothetical protein
MAMTLSIGTQASGLNQVEIWFGQIERERMAPGVFTSVQR